MLCPEVWNFPPPSHHFKFARGNTEAENSCTNLIDGHYFNYLVSVVLPDTINVPEVVKDSLSEDCDYYKVEEVHISDLINKDFIEAFVKKGQLTVLSDRTHIDTDDCVILTPTGHLILSLNKDVYQELGLEGKPSFFYKTKPNRYVVQLSLKEDYFKPGKNNYDRTLQRLKKMSQLKMNLLVAWDPPEETICPSSVAAYFTSRGHKVSLCEPQLYKHTSYALKVPLLSKEVQNDDSAHELMEWLGMLSIGADLNSGSSDNFVNSYECPLETVEIGAAVQLRWTGFFTFNQIHRLFDELRKYVSQRQSIPWVSLYVQGFADSPVSWKLQEHQFYTDGDNNYVIFLKPDGNTFYCSYISSNKRPKHKTK